MPVVCTFPHKRHLSHPTQSIIRVTLRKCVLNSSFSIWDYIFWFLAASFKRFLFYSRWRSPHGTERIRQTCRYFARWLSPLKLFPRSADRLRVFLTSNNQMLTDKVPGEQLREEEGQCWNRYTVNVLGGTLLDRRNTPDSAPTQQFIRRPHTNDMVRILPIGQ